MQPMMSCFCWVSVVDWVDEHGSLSGYMARPGVSSVIQVKVFSFLLRSRVGLVEGLTFIGYLRHE